MSISTAPVACRAGGLSWNGMFFGTTFLRLPIEYIPPAKPDPIATQPELA